MLDYNKVSEKLVFGLDIGTRSVVGSVGYMDRGKFNVIAHYYAEHETRAMVDGQIHDIEKVSETITKVKKQLEIQCGTTLHEVCIAAAGRVLRTKEVHMEFELSKEQKITSEHVYSLNLMGVERAYEMVREEETGMKFYCVGYTVVRYYMNDYIISNLEGHKAKKISSDVLATFLPEDVVNDLYSAVENAGLTVANLTLEPIAALNVAIPMSYRLLNLALVDVGAGTSDISITKDGSVIAYGMIPHAGDELTETLVTKYLVEFNTAEKIKRASLDVKDIHFRDVMGLEKVADPIEVREDYRSVMENMTKEIADKIMELNGGKSVSAVFVVGGGGKVYGFTENLAECLGLPEERVALRGEEVLTDVNFMNEEVKKDSILVTPIGICLSYYENKNNFVFVTINGERVKLYENNKLTVLDAAIQIGFKNEDLFPKRGKELEFHLNGTKKMVRGKAGETSYISVNGETASINSKIVKNDIVEIKPSTRGEAASLRIENLQEYRSAMHFIVNTKKITCPCFVEVNGELRSGDYEIQSGDQIQVLNYYTVEQLLKMMDLDMRMVRVLVNHVDAKPTDLIYDNFSVDFEARIQKKKTEKSAKSSDQTEHKDERKETNASADTAAPSTEQNVTEQAASEKATSEKSISGLNDKPVARTIQVKVNGRDVVLRNKVTYIFVDVLDVYPFDTTVAGGTSLITTINGEICEFTSEIHSGDILEIFWK